MYLGYIPVEYDRVYLQRFIRTLPILIIHCAAYHFQGTWTNAGKYNSQGNTFQLNDTKHNSFSFHVTSLKKNHFSKQYFSAWSLVQIVQKFIINILHGSVRNGEGRLSAGNTCIWFHWDGPVYTVD